MKKWFNVGMTAMAPVTATVRVRAESPEDADEVAREMNRSGEVPWEMGDGGPVEFVQTATEEE